MSNEQSDLETMKGSLAFLQETHDHAIRQLAEGVRKKYVLPACKKYKLTYGHLHGYFWFSAEQHPCHYHTAVDAKTAGFDLDEVFPFLELEVDEDGKLGKLVLGDYVAPVTLDDLKDAST